jgi:hypothetical protein
VGGGGSIGGEATIASKKGGFKLVLHLVVLH